MPISPKSVSSMNPPKTKAAITFTSDLIKLFFLAMVRLFSLAGFFAVSVFLAVLPFFFDWLVSVFFFVVLFFTAKAPPYEPITFLIATGVR